MIQFKFRRLEIPPNYNVNHLGKIRFLEVMGHFVFASLVLCNILIKLLVVSPPRNIGFSSKLVALF